MLISCCVADRTFLMLFAFFGFGRFLIRYPFKGMLGIINLNAANVTFMPMLRGVIAPLL